MGLVGFWIGSWIVGIALGIWLYNISPVFPGIDPGTANVRKGILLGGFLPCCGINIGSILLLYARTPTALAPWATLKNFRSASVKRASIHRPFASRHHLHRRRPIPS